MSTELWLGIGHYLLGVLIIFALLVALMEASRKYDRFREPAHLVQAVGYFLLLIWALLQTMVLGSGALLLVAVIAQILGFLCLLTGFYLYHHVHPLSDDEVPTKSTTTKTVVAKLSGKSQELMAMLSADGPAPVVEASAEPLSIEQSNIVENEKDNNEAVEMTEENSPELEDESDTDSVSSVSSVSEAAAEVAEAEIEPMPELKSSAEALETEKPIKKKKKKFEPVADEEIDLSYLATRKAKRGKAVKAEVAEIALEVVPPKENRDELMDDLFPLAESKSAVDTVETELLPGEVESKGKNKPKSSKKKNVPAALWLVGGVAAIEWTTVWPEVVVAALALLALVLLMPQRHQRGTSWLIAGFLVLLLNNVVALSIAPQLNGPILTPDRIGWLSLAIHAGNVLGYGLLGVAGWQKIKGKVTHHFLRIVSLVYLVLIVLTIGLAVVIANDVNTLQLLLVMMTGVLITILPIIHSLTYSHPHQPSSERNR